MPEVETTAAVLALEGVIGVATTMAFYFGLRMLSGRPSPNEAGGK